MPGRVGADGVSEVVVREDVAGSDRVEEEECGGVEDSDAVAGVSGAEEVPVEGDPSGGAEDQGVATGEAAGQGDGEEFPRSVDASVEVGTERERCHEDLQVVG